MRRLKRIGENYRFVIVLLVFIVAIGSFSFDVFSAVFYDFELLGLMGKFLVYLICLYQIVAYLFRYDMVSAYGQPLGLDRPVERAMYFCLYFLLIGMACFHSVTAMFQIFFRDLYL